MAKTPQAAGLHRASSISYVISMQRWRSCITAADAYLAKQGLSRPHHRILYVVALPKRPNTRLRGPYPLESGIRRSKARRGEKTVANCSDCAHGAAMSKSAIVCAYAAPRLFTRDVKRLVLRTVRSQIERQPKAPDANSLPTARQDRGSAPPRRRVRLVRSQGQRDFCLGPARLGGELPSQDRRDLSTAGEEEAMNAPIPLPKAS